MKGWTPEDGPTLAEAADLLATAPLEIEGRLPWSSNLTFLVAVDVGRDEPVRGVYKPAQGEQQLWDFPDGLYRREVAACVLSDLLGWAIVPPTIERYDAPFEVGSIQLFIETDYEVHYFTLFDDDDTYGHELRRIATFDLLANNADRKSGHVLRGSDGHLWGIDHGLCFHDEEKLRTVMWDYATEPIPEEFLRDVRRLEASPELVDDALGALLTYGELAALHGRIAVVAHHGHFPEPRGNRPPYPWPLV